MGMVSGKSEKPQNSINLSDSATYTILPNRMRRAVWIHTMYSSAARKSKHVFAVYKASGYMSNTVADFYPSEHTKLSPNTQLNTT